MTNRYDPPKTEGEKAADKATDKTLWICSASALLATAFSLVGAPDYWYKLFVWLLVYLFLFVIISAMAD